MLNWSRAAAQDPLALSPRRRLAVACEGGVPPAIPARPFGLGFGFDRALSGSQLPHAATWFTPSGAEAQHTGTLIIGASIKNASANRFAY